MRPLVSIGLPTFNRARFLKETLPTILAQRYEPLEILISDNASTDDTEALGRMMEAADSRIRYLRQSENIGLYPNHNALIEESHGEYLCFFHDDDEYAPTILREEVSFLMDHPDAGVVTEEIDATIARVAGECHLYDMPLFVEPLSYSINADVKADSAEFAADRPRIVRETARRLSQLGIDVLKLEFPVNVAYEPDEKAWQTACEAVSEASAVPWTLLSAGVNFDAYVRQVTIACQSGASGLVGGRAIWKESIALTQQERAAFLMNEGVRRFDQLREIVESSARPWTDFYTPPVYGENWYEAYRSE